VLALEWVSHLSVATCSFLVRPAESSPPFFALFLRTSIGLGRMSPTPSGLFGWYKLHCHKHFLAAAPSCLLVPVVLSHHSLQPELEVMCSAEWRLLNLKLLSGPHTHWQSESQLLPQLPVPLPVLPAIIPSLLL
jgi:hypothetical protein